MLTWTIIVMENSRGFRMATYTNETEAREKASAAAKGMDSPMFGHRTVYIIDPFGMHSQVFP
jgi:hypothetical protein